MVKIVYEQGVPFIDIDGGRFEPVVFESFRPRPDNVYMAYRTGIRLFQVFVSGLNNGFEVPYSLYGGVWKGDGKYDFSAFDRQMKMFMHFAPEGYFIIRLQLDTCDWYTESHPEEVGDSRHHLSEWAMNEEWKRATADYLRTFIAYAEEKYGDRIWGYLLAGGNSSEWFDFSIPDRSFNRDNTRLTRLWRNIIGKPDAIVPTIDTLEKGEGLRAPSSDEFCYMELAAEQNSKLICFFAAEAQKVLEHRKLIGLFYGYGNSTWMLYKNTSDYERVWQSTDIDILCAPAAYGDNRYLDGVSSYQNTVDSVRLNQKLYLHESDHRTELSLYPLENGRFVVGGDGEIDNYDTFEDWREVFRRELCNVIQKQVGFKLMDFFGGYFGAPEYEEELRRGMEILHTLSQMERHSVAEIAVFLDPKTYLCTREYNDLQRDLSIRTVNEMLRCGAPFELYNLNDLKRLDIDRYKMFVFPNAYLLTDEMRTFIRERLKGRMKIFAHADGMWNGREYSLECISELCGMRIAERHNPSSQSEYKGVRYGFGKEVLPLFQVEDHQAQALALFDDGAVSCARKGETVYTCVPELPWQLVRDLAKDAGVHVYSEQGSGTAICSRVISAYTTLTEDCELHMPEDGCYHEMFHDQTYECKDGLLCYHAPLGTTMLFVKENDWKAN